MKISTILHWHLIPAKKKPFKMVDDHDVGVKRYALLSHPYFSCHGVPKKILDNAFIGRINYEWSKQPSQLAPERILHRHGQR